MRSRREVLIGDKITEYLKRNVGFNLGAYTVRRVLDQTYANMLYSNVASQLLFDISDYKFSFSLRNLSIDHLLTNSHYHIPFSELLTNVEVGENLELAKEYLIKRHRENEKKYLEQKYALNEVVTSNTDIISVVKEILTPEFTAEKIKEYVMDKVKFNPDLYEFTYLDDINMVKVLSLVINSATLYDLSKTTRNNNVLDEIVVDIKSEIVYKNFKEEQKIKAANEHIKLVEKYISEHNITEIKTDKSHYIIYDMRKESNKLINSVTEIQI